jgi:hypothetical protein
MANGRPVDAQGYPATDPTKNVIDVLEAAVKRIDDQAHSAAKRNDDLRRAQERLSEERERSIEKLARVRQWAASEAAKGQRRETKAESKRLDAVRTVDVAASAVATATAERTAGLLAAQLNTTAETLRGQVASAALVQEQKLETLFNPMRADIRELREASSKTAGKDSAAFDPLLQEFKQMRLDQATRDGELLAATRAAGVANQKAADNQQGFRWTATTAIAAFYAIVATIGLIVLFATGHG